MARFDVTVVVEYRYEVEADSYEEADAEGWNYEDYRMFSTVDSIDVRELDDDEQV
jgi:hypothetical protein